MKGNTRYIEAANSVGLVTESRPGNFKMLYLQRPQIDRIRAWLQQQSQLDLTYPEIGGSQASAMPAAYHHIDWSCSLGSGDAVFRLATQAMQQWSSFNLDWASIVTDGAPARNRTMAIAARVGGLWSVNFCRMVDYDPGISDARSWSFAVGTLPRHMACGEERISVTLDKFSGEVVYRVRSFSKPRNWLARMTKPLVRYQQTRFCRDSGISMTRYIRARDRVPVSNPAPVTASLPD